MTDAAEQGGIGEFLERNKIDLDALKGATGSPNAKNSMLDEDELRAQSII